MQRRVTTDASDQSPTIHDRENAVTDTSCLDRLNTTPGAPSDSIVGSHFPKGSIGIYSSYRKSDPAGRSVLSGFMPARMAPSIAVAAARHPRDLPGPPADRSPVIPGINPGTWQSPSRSPPWGPRRITRKTRLHLYRTGPGAIAVRARVCRRYPRPEGTHDGLPGQFAA